MALYVVTAITDPLLARDDEDWLGADTQNAKVVHSMERSEFIFHFQSAPDENGWELPGDLAQSEFEKHVTYVLQEQMRTTIRSIAAEGPLSDDETVTRLMADLEHELGG